MATVHKRNLELKGFQEVQEIGRGTFSSVFEVYSDVDGQSYAVKCVSERDCGMEPELLKETDHINIIKCYDTWTTREVVSSKIDVNDTAGTDGQIQETGETWTRQLEQFGQDADHIGDVSELGIKLINQTDIEDDEPSDNGFQHITQKNDLNDGRNSPLSCLDTGDKEGRPLLYPEPNSCQEKPGECWVYMQLERCDGTLADLLYGKENYDQMQLKAMFRSIVEGVAYLHSKNIVHLDLKPENIFIKKQLQAGAVDDTGITEKTIPEIVIGDLGNARKFIDGEVFQFQEAVDMHALGKLVVSMLFKAKSDEESRMICKAIRDGHYSYKSVESWLFDLTKKMFLTDGQQHCLSAKEVLNENTYSSVWSLDQMPE